MKLFFRQYVLSLCYVFSMFINAQELTGTPLKADQMPLGVRNAAQSIADILVNNGQWIKQGFFITDKYFIAPIDQAFFSFGHNTHRIIQSQNLLQGDKQNTVHKQLPLSLTPELIREARFIDSLLSLWWSGTENLPFPDFPLGVFEIKGNHALSNSFLKLVNFRNGFQPGDSLYLLINVNSDVHRIAVIEIAGLQPKDIVKGVWISLEKINSPYLEWAKGAFNEGVVFNKHGEVVALVDTDNRFLRLRKVDPALESLKDRIEARQQSPALKKLNRTKFLYSAVDRGKNIAAPICMTSFKKPPFKKMAFKK